jgi:2-succinyl-5-enolpyruvyl-6-hydroxy-3-cyclohexene-1-carboxylate synthase
VSSPSAGDVALACMTTFVNELAASGVRHACVSPGSRSTAIALALDRHPAIAVHVHLDERSSAFFALGAAKADGRPTIVACTSGTAAAEMLPAVVEASTSCVPLLVLTADRPPELHGTGANQTIDQLGLYGRFARATLQSDVPAARPGADDDWRALGRRAATLALDRPPAPVHVNLPFVEPLTPTARKWPSGADGIGEDASASTAAEETDAAPPAAMTVPRGVREPEALPVLADVLERTERGVIVAGETVDDPDGSVVRLARALRWPLVAEPASGLRLSGVSALGAGQMLLANEAFARAHRPALVLQLGATPTSRPTQALTAASDRLAVVRSPGRPADPLRRASPNVVGDVSAAAARLTGAVSERSASGWLEEWSKADAVARRAVDGLLDGWAEPFEGRVARDLAAAVPAGATLVAGSSLPIRDLDAFMAPRAPLRVLANRGASGIDGLVATTFGVAAASRPNPIYALLGDLTVLHDVGTLVWSGRTALGATLVVPNNRGGRIFSVLPQGTLPEHERLFATPHDIDLGAVAAAAGVAHERVEHAGELVPAIIEASGPATIRLIEVAIDPRLTVPRYAEVRRVVADALASMG